MSQNKIKPIRYIASRKVAEKCARLKYGTAGKITLTKRGYVIFKGIVEKNISTGLPAQAKDKK